jgi:hypothetical protein
MTTLVPTPNKYLAQNPIGNGRRRPSPSKSAQRQVLMIVVYITFDEHP